MTKQQKQRIAVAKDVIAQLKAEKLVAVTGTYVEHDAINESAVGQELQTVLAKELKADAPCQVCAMGACFISTIRLYDDFKLTEGAVEYGSIDAKVLKRKVAQIFGRREMQVLESFFENEGPWLRNQKDARLFGRDPAVRDYTTNLSETDRLIFLMEVVIANPRTPITVQVVKDTYLKLILDGKLKEEKDRLGL